MTKLAYERPLMRAEVFRTNAYAEGCNRVVVGVHDLLKFVFNGLELFFSDTRHDTINMNTGEAEYYFKEHADYDKTDATYFLEYSAQNKNFNLYEDHANSGYGATDYGFLGAPTGTPQVDGKGTLQSALGSGYSGSWTLTANNPAGVDNAWYFSDTVKQTDISFDQVQGAEMGMSF